MQSGDATAKYLFPVQGWSAVFFWCAPVYRAAAWPWCSLSWWLGSKDHLTSYRLLSHVFRKAGVPCILVRGKGKGSSYEVGDQHISGRNTWAVVFLEGSWRYVFPHWAFIGLNAFSTGHWTLVEDSGKPARDRYDVTGRTACLKFTVNNYW